MIRAAIAATFLVFALCASPDARAQEGDGCSWSVGAAGNTSPAGRDWDLSTPEAFWSLSPAVSQQCHLVDDGGAVRPWVGVMAVPTLQHRYRAIGERGTLGALLSLGLGLRVAPRVSIGPHLTTNITAWGVGARMIALRPPTNRLRLHGVEARIQWMSGINPDFQGIVLVHVHHRWTGWYSEEEHLPAERRQLERPWTVATGFEAGELVGWRIELRPGGAFDARPELGLRVGVLTNLFADAAVQPTGLAYVDVPIDIADGAPQVELSAGVTRRDGALVPLGGVAAQLDPPDSVLQGQLGLLVGGGERVWATVDGGLAWVW